MKHLISPKCHYCLLLFCIFRAQLEIKSSCVLLLLLFIPAHPTFSSLALLHLLSALLFLPPVLLILCACVSQMQIFFLLLLGYLVRS